MAAWLMGHVNPPLGRRLLPQQVRRLHDLNFVL
jgi:hypothetical protein